MKSAVGSEPVVHAHALAHEALAPSDEGTSLAKRGGARLRKQPGAIRGGQRRYRDGVLVLQPVEDLGDAELRLDEANRRRTCDASVARLIQLHLS